MLKPTNVPLTSKSFSEELCGVCFGCGCYCGYILYREGNKIIDLYGHPHDENGMGSLCTKGITYIQQLRDNPLRLKEAKIRGGDTWQEIPLQRALELAKERLRGKKLGIFLDRWTDLRDYRTARSLTENVYSDAIYLPFKPTTLKPQDWARQRLILSLEFEPEFSEVMSARWIVDAVERGAYLFNISSRFSTVASKSSKNLTLNPYRIAKFLEDMALQAEGKAVVSEFEEHITRLLKGLSTVKESVIIIGDTLLRSEYRNTVLRSLQSIVRSLGVNYSIVGDVSTLPVKELKDFLQEIKSLEGLILSGNLLRYAEDRLIRDLKDTFKVNLSLFPGITALNSELIIPGKAFYEREFLGYRNGFGMLRDSGATLEFNHGMSLSELLRSLSDIDIKTAFGGDLDNLPDIRDIEIPPAELGEEPELFLLVDRTLVEDLGHWNPWTHAIEREQFAYMSEETASRLGIKDSETLSVGSAELKVKINNNVAKGVVFVPEAFDEFQPFNEGVRIGRLMRKPYLRVEEIEL